MALANPNGGRSPVTWEDFKELEPGLAALGEERFRLSGMVLPGSLRKNG
jgi:hypothetical protein